MKLRPEQINEHVSKGLLPVYLITGDEPLQVMETVDVVRKQALAKGYTEREILHVEGQFDWSSLAGVSDALSLFSERKVLDVRFSSNKIGQQGAKALQAYLSRPPEDKLLLIQAPRMDRRTLNTAWAKAIEKGGVLVQIWDLSRLKTHAWVAKRMRTEGLQPTQHAARLLTERVEGNLLAAAQEINKLVLLYGKGEIDDVQVLDSVTDSSRFSIFDLTDAILLGDKKRIQHILQVLREEGTALQLVLWAITDVLRQLYLATFNKRHGIADTAIVGRMPKQRQGVFRSAVNRLHALSWDDALQRAANIDQLTKGVGKIVAKGDSRVWDEMLDLSFKLASHG